MAYRRPGPSIGTAVKAAQKGNFYQLQKVLEQLDARANDLETKTSSQTMNSQSPSPVAAPPPPAGVAASAVPGSGRFSLQITNPEYLGRGNVTKSPILHLVEASPVANFSTGVVPFPIGTQTTYSIPVEDVGGIPGQTLTRYLRVSSSQDGVNFNNPQITGPLTA